MIQLRDYQQAAVDSLFHYWTHDRGINPLIEAPTGSGKSVMMAEWVRRCTHDWPGTRIMLLAHVKELIQQNAQALMRLVPGIDIGIYSAGLNMRHTRQSVIVSGIQSVHGKHDQFGFIDLVAVDEAHMINVRSQGRYREFLDGLRIANPNLRIVGFTATPFRLGHGYIDRGDGALFDGTAYKIDVASLIDKGHLAPPVPRPGSEHADLSDVRIRGGEYVEGDLAAAFDREYMTESLIRDLKQYASDRRSILVFCCSVEHAEHVRAALLEAGETSVEMVTGKTSAADRRALVDAVRSGRLRILLNVAVFTTGFDAPNIDCIVLLRATHSTALYLQMIGRGLRTATGKRDCLVLDYGENVLRHGPINDVRVKEVERGKKRKAQPPAAKECPECGVLVGASCVYCPTEGCDHEWPRETASNLTVDASTAAFLDPNALQPGQKVWKEVVGMACVRHAKIGGTASVRIDYRISDVFFVSEWVCFDHKGYARHKATRWAMARGVPHDEALALTVEQALAMEWPEPSEVLIERNDNKFFGIKDARFEAMEVAS